MANRTPCSPDRHQAHALRVTVILTAVAGAAADVLPVVDLLGTVAAAAGGHRVPGLRQVAVALVANRLRVAAEDVVGLVPTLSGLVTVGALAGAVAAVITAGWPSQVVVWRAGLGHRVVPAWRVLAIQRR